MYGAWGRNGFNPYTPLPQMGSTPPSMPGMTNTSSSYHSGASDKAYYSGHNSSVPSASTAMMHSGSGETRKSTLSPLSPDFQVRGQSLEDPFVDGGASRALSPHHNMTSPAELAQLIKSGAFEDPDNMLPLDNRTQRVTTTTAAPTSTPRHPAPTVQPVVHLWGSHMVQSVEEPGFLSYVQTGRLPPIEEAIHYQPFTFPADAMPVSQGGVVLVKNIPYASTKAEIIAAIGRNARIVAQPAGSPFYAIHIIMERSTGKTMDCYVELENKAEAKSIVYAYRSRCDRGRTPRVGERHIEVELSSQEELMEQLFPKARCVKWEGQMPVVFEPTEAYNSGFMGFVTTEECAMLVKHAENPQRSPFVARALNRAYESLISILWKYPWFSTNHTTLAERAVLHRTTLSLLRVLFRAVSTCSHPLQLSQALLQELLCAALTVPFSHIQKFTTAELAASSGFGAVVASIGYTPLFKHSPSWPFAALDIAPGVSARVVAYYASLLAQGSFTSASSVHLSDHEAATLSTSPFGAFRPDTTSTASERVMTLDKAARIEWEALATVLGAVLCPQYTAPAQDQQLVEYSPTNDPTHLHQQEKEKVFDAAPGAGRKRTPPSAGEGQEGKRLRPYAGMELDGLAEDMQDSLALTPLAYPMIEGRGAEKKSGLVAPVNTPEAVEKSKQGGGNLPGLGAGVGKVKAGASFADIARKD
ncbi:hypothetical protein K461DRAFT_271180 [Myriangium duriaei CBS 260.36]|uniref:RRM domain-containing protein n=1 Tax=Myriangium duriaei CBS 260.36 TaxID=1168546 RepID=A0A9P4IXM3_9PEZI|nr:hypothetical protein K461DRAFT_271180 [Myriangium duriaei CBS 260.36]